MRRHLYGLMGWLGRVAAFMLCWVAVSMTVYVVVEPQYDAVYDAEYFYVCATRRHGGDDLPVYPLGEVRAHQDEYQLCDAPARHDGEHLTRIELYRLDPNTWYLARHTDGLGDPIEYVYQQDGDKITPLARRSGTQMMKFFAGVVGLVLGAMLYMWLKRLHAKRRAKRAQRMT